MHFLLLQPPLFSEQTSFTMCPTPSWCNKRNSSSLAWLLKISVNTYRWSQMKQLPILKIMYLRVNSCHVPGLIRTISCTHIVFFFLVLFRSENSTIRKRCLQSSLRDYHLYSSGHSSRSRSPRRSQQIIRRFIPWLRRRVYSVAFCIPQPTIAIISTSWPGTSGDAKLLHQYHSQTTKRQQRRPAGRHDW